MSLKGTFDRDYMSRTIKDYSETFIIPRGISVIDAKVALASGRGRLLKCIGSIAKADNETVNCRKSEEQAHTRLFDAGGIGLNE
jgi:hypothetical protein